MASEYEIIFCSAIPEKKQKVIKKYVKRINFQKASDLSKAISIIKKFMNIDIAFRRMDNTVLISLAEQ